MVRSAASLIRTRGVNATSFSEVLADSGAPRGSIYHHFPEGKKQLAEDAIRWTSERVLAHLRAGAAPGRMRVPHWRAGGGGAAPGGAVKPRGKYDGTSYGRVLARRSVHGSRSERPRHCRGARLSPASAYRLVAASAARGSTTRIRADMVAARGPHDRVSDRPAFDERSGIRSDNGRSGQDRATCILYGCEPACPDHLPSGQSQPRARQLRRFVQRLCMAVHGRRPALRRLSGRRLSLRSARL